jgi:hypothetical protein
MNESAVSSDNDLISSSVVGSPGGSGLGVEVTLDSEAATGLTGGGDALQLSVLLVGGGNPVDSGVIADAVVGRVAHDHLEVLVGSILSNPVAVEHSQASQSAAAPFFGLGAKVAGGLQLVDTHGSGLSGDNTLGNRSFAASSSDSDSVDDIALFGLEAEFSGLIGARRVVDAGDDWQLTVLPGSDPEDKVHQVALLLSPEFFQILIGSHTTIIITNIIFNFQLNIIFSIFSRNLPSLVSLA